jgi:galactokinase
LTVALAPGRVNIIGDHTDYVGGLALPCAIDLAVTSTFERAEDIRLTSDATAEPAEFAIPVDGDAYAGTMWTRLVRAVATRLPAVRGAHGRLTTTLPIGAGLSSSAACVVALALTLGFEDDDTDLVLLAQAAEQDATGVPVGVLDQLAIVHGKAGHVLVVHAAEVRATPVPMPSRAGLVIVPSGHHRALRDTPYAERRLEAERAMAEVGGLDGATLADALSVADPVLRKRARHVITENERVRECADAFANDDLRRAGELMLESHTSLRKDAEVSTKDLTQLVDALSTRKGVFGARLTGAGFGGSVIALVDLGAAAAIADTFGGRVVTASDGARLIDH